MKIAIAGYKGFIGSALLDEFGEHELVLLERNVLYGDVEVLAESIDGVDVVMNFAGYSVSKRWTSGNRKKIRESRVMVTRNLVKAAKETRNRPKHFVFASGINIYKNGMQHNENSDDFADGFLADTVKRWENEMEPAKQLGRVSIIRMGMVLGNSGGAFPLLRRVFGYYLGGVLGSGKQVYSFIHIDDLVKMIRMCLEQEIDGVVNATTPFPLTNREFSIRLARSMKRPLLFRVPGWALKLVLGKNAEVVLEGQTVIPARMMSEGFDFCYPDLNAALENLIN